MGKRTHKVLKEAKDFVIREGKKYFHNNKHVLIKKGKGMLRRELKKKKYAKTIKKASEVNALAKQYTGKSLNEHAANTKYGRKVAENLNVDSSRKRTEHYVGTADKGSPMKAERNTFPKSDQLEHAAKNKDSLYSHLWEKRSNVGKMGTSSGQGSRNPFNGAA